MEDIALVDRAIELPPLNFSVARLTD